MVQARSELGKDYGVVIVPEGLVEFVPEMNILI
jgi:6-phosphofructokinase